MSILEVLKVNKNDTGIFTCKIDNGIGSAVSTNITLIVKHKPIVKQPEVSIIAL